MRPNPKRSVQFNSTHTIPKRKLSCAGCGTLDDLGGFRHAPRNVMIAGLAVVGALSIGTAIANVSAAIGINSKKNISVRTNSNIDAERFDNLGARGSRSPVSES